MLKRSALCLCLLAIAPPAYAQDHAHGHSGHESHAATTASLTIPLEGGQGAFTAIAEIVALLQADPGTDWEKVDIAALQEHLLDMSLLTLQSDVEPLGLPNGAAFKITANGRSLEAVQRMVMAHAPFLADATGWQVSSELVEDGAILQVSSSDRSEAQMIEALGFYGLMATDAHHQEHHLAIATGQIVH